MRRTKEQKGITLIALIITIVVLLILAVVAINSIQDGGILSYATNAATDYNKAVENESQMLQNYVDYLDKYSDKYNGGSTGTTTYTAYTLGQEVKVLDKDGPESAWSNLNNYTIPDGVTSVITTAKTYGDKFEGATGRLMREDEARPLSTDTTFSSKLFEENFWLGSANDIICVWVTEGSAGSVGSYGDYGYDFIYGVRPVIEISKSNIS